MFALIMWTLSSASANWNPAWYDQTEIIWSGSEKTATDPAGISIFCGLGHFSKKTRILLTMQNRTDGELCFSVQNLIDLTDEENHKLQESILGFKASIIRAVVKSKLNIQEAYQQKVNKGISCRILSPSEPGLPPFKTEEDRPACLVEPMRLSAGNIFEASYEFIAPGLDLTEFQMMEITDCKGNKVSPEKIGFTCKRP